MRHSLLLCILIFTCQFAGVAQAPPPSKLFPLSPSAFMNELRDISGKNGIDCGTISDSKPENSVAACGQKAFEEGKPFFLAYLDRAKTYLSSGYGIAGDETGKVFVVTYRFFPPFPAVVTSRSKVTDDSHTQISECVQPVKLETTSDGMLACIIPVNQDESDKAAHQIRVETSICAVLQNPAAWNNKLVRIRGHYSGNFEYSSLSSDDCDESLWFEYAGGEGPPSLAAHVGGGAMPGAEDADGKLILPIPITLVRDSKFEQFEKQVEAMAKADNDSYKKNPNKFVDHCVTATFTGRVDTVSSEIHQFHKTHPNNRSDFSGFGQMGSYDGQFVLQRVDSDSVMGACKN